jgi:hypothetical protein
MVKRLLRRQLVDTLHTKRSERLFPLLKSSLRDDGGVAEQRCGSVIAGPGLRDGSLPVRQRPDCQRSQSSYGPISYRAAGNRM